MNYKIGDRVFVYPNSDEELPYSDEGYEGSITGEVDGKPDAPHLWRVLISAEDGSSYGYIAWESELQPDDRSECAR